jgi:hypothetical protein
MNGRVGVIGLEDRSIGIYQGGSEGETGVADEQVECDMGGGWQEGHYCQMYDNIVGLILRIMYNYVNLKLLIC